MNDDANVELHGYQANGRRLLHLRFESMIRFSVASGWAGDLDEHIKRVPASGTSSRWIWNVELARKVRRLRESMAQAAEAEDAFEEMTATLANSASSYRVSELMNDKDEWVKRNIGDLRRILAALDGRERLMRMS